MAGMLVLIAFVWGMLAFAVAIDASRRGRHGGFWAVLTFLTGVFGVVVYGLVVLFTSDPDDEASEDDEEPETVRVCSVCSSKHDGSPSYCEDCGTDLGPEDDRPVGRRLMTGSDRYCSNCRSGVDRESNACPSCGAVF